MRNNNMDENTRNLEVVCDRSSNLDTNSIVPFGVNTNKSGEATVSTKNGGWCSLCSDNSKDTYLNVETIQIENNFVPITEMTAVFKNLEELWNSNDHKNICGDCLQALQSSYLFYRKCLRKEKTLNNEFREIVDNSHLTMSTKLGKAQPFKCCGERFSRKSLLDQHKQNVHGVVCRFPCQSCPKRFLSKRSLLVHEISHKKPKNSKELYCDLCERQFIHLGTFNKHIERHSDFVCYYCNRGFTDAEITKAHIADRHEKNGKRCFGCISCKKTFFTRKILLRHFRTVHARTIRFFCGQCEEPFDAKDKLKEHLSKCDKKKSDTNDEYWNIEHLNFDDDLNLSTEWLNGDMLRDDYLNVDNGESMVEEFLDEAFEILAAESEELECHHCSNVFKSARDLIMHDITNHDNVKRDVPDTQTLSKEPPCYKCPRCEEKFSKQNNLNIHLAHNHGEFVLVCNECGAAYNEIQKLREHRKEHQMENMTSPLSDPQNIRGGKSLCTLCDKYFTTNGLKYHLKTHSNVVRSFTCPFCDKKFIAKTNLNAHVRIRHSEVKQNPCSYCDRRFATMDHLKKHIASTHLDIKNHKCVMCDKSFRQRSHLNQHLWQHNGVKQYQCTLCVKAYTSKPSLRNHIEKVHSLAE